MNNVSATLRFTLLLVLIAIVAALIAVRERPLPHSAGSPVPAAIR
jgi:hypothetical protein